ncbi:hydrogenase expression/formation protein HypE [Streptomyces sp. RKAG337]|uniref:hydrogenase expression/formation protein HypE n=1 Tax=Streptomyces sp. RKAG337 TaxID=2893404 RepID=UPI0020334390|nr:hydrogenase expression/formation protein HypE [Streptomyces sp. RKAG337]MCM2426175.1 hydrogenase expression/formation protein HypE [Streptomyces sp. RKAG337]
MDVNSWPVGQVALADDSGTGPRQLAALVLDVLGPGLAPGGLPPLSGEPLVVRTGGYVVDPPFFGNGDLGRLAVAGTVNALIATGADPYALTLGLIVEAGTPLQLLRRITESVRDTAHEAGIAIAAVDTRVVRAGDADQLFLTATGIGVHRRPPLPLSGVRPGDRVLVTAPLGNHAVHLLSLRAGLGFEHHVPSDCAPLTSLLNGLPPGALRAAAPITSGGLAATLRDCATARGLTLRIDEGALPVQYEARPAFELLGLSPLHAANAGSMCLFAPPAAADAVLAALRSHPYGRQAAIVGTVTDDTAGAVELRSPDGPVHRLPAGVPPGSAEPPRLR